VITVTGHDRSIDVADAPDGATVEDLLRACAPQVLGIVARRFGDFAAADDAVQGALVEAALRWPSDGIPRNPRGWLIQVAVRKLTDQIRSEQARRRREELAVRCDAPTASAATAVAGGAVEAAALAAGDGGGGGGDVDDTLALLFLCCHPALTRASAVALTLRAVGGLTTAEIARAFVVPQTTMAHRISRAKRTITASGLPFRLPTGDERPERLAAVLHVLYLVFNEGHTASAGADLQRTDLADEAIRLAHR
jgi:RNA polymerase sigma factor (sigma-70 family)